MKKQLLSGMIALGLFALPSVAFADSISPTSFAATLGVGESTTITKTVTVSDAPPSDALVDVLFFADTTGSMGAALAAVKSSIGTIATTVDPLGDVQWGVAEYKDTTDSEPVRPYELRQDITNNNAAVTAAVNALNATGGGDTPEGQLPSLKEAAETTSWRAGSTRILVWFGDAPGHDPRAGVTEAQAIAALQTENIEVQAISVTSGAGGLTNQATRIADATGGEHRIGIDSSAIATEISNAIISAIDTYSTVSLDLSEAPAGVGVSSIPGSYIGAFDRSIERMFDFELTFTGLVPGDYSFDIHGLVDGGRVATEADRIRVTGSSIPVSEPGTLAIFGMSIVLLGLVRRRRRS